MYELALKDFRGFREADFVEIRPITVLIGENSAGKSSFLAALKYIFDFISGEEEPSYNKDPFQLGTFQQIAHYRGGKAGRAREFRLKMRAEASTNRRDPARDSERVTFEISFVNFDSQTVIQTIDISVKSESLSAKIDGDRLKISFRASNGETYQIDESTTLPRIARSEFARYWPFLLRDLRYRMRRIAGENQEPLFGKDIESATMNLTELAEAFSRKVSGHVEATSAIRTKPLRTYTPGVEFRDGEGSHVPFEMAKLSRGRNKDAWNKIKGSIEDFGMKSEMFKELGIKSFGQTASDPFQIQFSFDGPKTNIVDLGYGISQILPILYNTSTATRRSKFLIQQPEVHIHPKAQAALGTFFVDSFVKEGKEFLLETHSDYIVDRIRHAVAIGNIKPSDVSILFFERKRLENTVTLIEVDDSGIPIDPPDSYRSFFLDEQMKILGL